MSHDAEEAAKVAFTAGVTAAYAAGGYVNGEGQRNDAALAEAVFAAVEAAQVDGLKKREADAATRGTIIATLFPSLPKVLDEWNAQPDPALAEKIYGEIRRIVWDLLKMDKSGKVQQLVGLRHPGFVLCRTKVGQDHTDAAYITEDQGCITTDFVTPLNASIVSANKKMGRNMAMIVDRKPELATKWQRLYKNANTKGLEAGSVPLDMSLEAARNNGQPDGDDNPGE